MLATHPPTSSPPFATFLPPHPSPLSPRSANIHGPRAFMSANTTSNARDGQENSSNYNHNDATHIPFAKRAVKKAPSPKQDELKERRRSMFLKKVRQGRDDKRFEARGEDIMRLDFMRHQRAWEAAQARDAPFIPSDPVEPEEDDEYDLPSSGSAMQFSQPDEEGVDDVAQMEDRELEALLEFMPVDEVETEVGKGYRGQMEQQAQNLWSDDDDGYDELFSELMEQDSEQATASQGQRCQQAPSQVQTRQQDDEEAMDMS